MPTNDNDRLSRYGSGIYGGSNSSADISLIGFFEFGKNKAGLKEMLVEVANLTRCVIFDIKD